MNKVILIGRLTKDPDIKYQGSNNTPICRLNLAVQRNYKNKEGKYDADFISCTAYKSTAEFLEKYFHKGSQIVIEGEWRTGSYEKDGTRIYTNECVVSKAEFCGSKADNNQENKPSTPPPANANDDFVDVDSVDTDSIPFF